MNVMSTGLGPVWNNLKILTSTTSAVTSINWSANTDPEFSGSFVWQLLIQVLSLALICIGALVGNFLVFFSLLKKDQLGIPSNRLVFSLTISNFALAALVFPFTVVSLIQNEWAFGVFWCNFTAFLTVLVTSASVLTIGVITVDRYYAIVRPLLYTLTVTSSRSSWLLFSVWFLAFFCAAPPLFGWSKFRYHHSVGTCMADWSEDAIYTSFVLSTTILLPLAAMLVCYYLIFQVIRKKCRKINVGRVDAFDNHELTTDIQLPKYRTQNVTRQQSSWRFTLTRKPSWLLTAYASPIKGFRTICVVIGVFLVTSAPYLITALARACSAGDALPKWFHILSAWLWLSSSATHPIIYGVLNRSIRKELKSSICPTLKQRERLSERTRNLNKRFSKSISLLDFSPLKLVAGNGNWSSVASVDTCGSYSRKGSQDSGTVLTESDLETETSFRTSSQRNRRRVSAPSRLHLMSTIFNRNQNQNLEQFPVLQALVSEAKTTELRKTRLSSGNNKTSLDDLQSGLEFNVEENLSSTYKKKLSATQEDEGIIEDFN